MRFWKGPGYQWPYNIHTPEDICIPTRRDEHIHIQNLIFRYLRDQYQSDIRLNAWINSLPVLNYNSVVGAEIFSGQNISQMVENYLSRFACMGFGGNIFWKTGYYFITKVLNLNPIDSFINKMLPQLLDIERKIVNDQLQDPEVSKFIQIINRRGIVDQLIRDKITVLKERQTELNHEFRQLDKFEYGNMGPLKHI